MFIRQLALPRRTFLRGMGAALALPLLDAMVPALSVVGRAAAEPVRRLGFIYIPNGAIMEQWTPKAEGASFEVSPTLAPVAAFRDQMVVVTGLTNAMAESMGDGNGGHSRASAVALTAVHPKWTEGADILAGTSVDQYAAEQLGKQTPLRSLELAIDLNFMVGNCENGYSCAYLNTISWRTPTTPNPMENNPRAVFERMFGDGGTAAERLAETRRDRSILDWVRADVSRLQRELGAGDRRRVDEYLDSIREVERRIQTAEKQTADPSLELSDRPVGIPTDYGEHVAIMFDLLALAFRADVTRVFTFMLGREVSNRAYTNIGIVDPHHGISHHQNDPEKMAKVAKINTYHLQLTSRFLETLRSTPEGDGTLLDHALVVHGGGMSNPNEHSYVGLPMVVFGGGSGQLKGGRHLRYPVETPVANLYLSLLDKVGAPIEKLGDSTGRLALEPLSAV
jgi:hypothetical protein